MAGHRPLIPVLVGPTAVGKTAVALELGQRWPVTVISADSRQVYRRLDIGTAKPTRQERALVPHVGIDVVDPGDRYSAGRFARDAVSWLEAVDADRLPMVVGGTGFYIRALADGLFREPPFDPAQRERLRRWVRHAPRLGRWASRLDPAFRGGGQQRAARAVEIALLTGRSLSWWQHTARQEGIMRPWYVKLIVPRAVLHRRITQRVHAMLESGLVAEVEGVLKAGVAAGAPGLDGVGYRQVVQHLEGSLPRDRLAEAIGGATRQYAKRQETWFRHQLAGHPVLTLDATASPAGLADQIVGHWEERGR